MKQIVFDYRTGKGMIWNLQEILAAYPFGLTDSPWNKPGISTTDEEWIDLFVYEGYSQYGKDFLKYVEGRFAIVYYDKVKHRIFITRDWMGEMPLHYLIAQNGFYLANTIYRIKEAMQQDFTYENIRAFPQGYCQVIELNNSDENNIAATYRPDKRQLYYDFEEEVISKSNLETDIEKFDFPALSAYIKEAVLKRSRNTNGINCLLLSGGLDSLCIAVAMKSAGVNFETFTLSIDDKLGEADMADIFAKKLGVKHTVINVSTDEIVSSFDESVRIGEAYHLYNVYCTLGMLLLGKKLAELGITKAFCGEAMNEAVGDYKDWCVYNPILKKNILLQKINTERLQNIPERILYVWGNSVDKGKYNRQLGTGLAKHASARMVKPFMANNIDLHCPYYQPSFLSSIVAFSPRQLKEIGYKPGLLWRIFKNDFEQYGFDEAMIKQCKKIRLQDASENGEYGISSILLASGDNQEKALSIFNNFFNTNYNIKDKTKTLLCTA